MSQQLWFEVWILKAENYLVSGSLDTALRNQTVSLCVGCTVELVSTRRHSDKIAKNERIQLLLLNCFARSVQ